ncbi:ABC-2 type transporter [Xylanimonas cellulosilytica DSM 15894]|uniref:Transport permease protein n=1 Tax=Xylanimonas cellulosilytica (strain DSM 15894 / JCM 12276 / CECT 5975 / KCTC 9989 / LMG 20990 / NBRC 107835 / XIL07) TaxID=446471 RepID=D1BRD0_XYLCX|nr:ABC transporter permease [Xylanimonas cellulosilytica]ACZ30385.1 ABC-2 type transporter [Xylanimonas cellulosilytica DSM 15894]
MTAATAPVAPAAAPAWRRVLTQAAFESRTVLRNGEQLLVTIALPLFLLVGLARTAVVELDTGGAARIDFVTPGVLAVAIMSTAFTSQAIATAFDRRNGVLRLLATTPLGRRGLLAGKVLAVLAIELVQAVVLCGVALALGWRPDAAGIPAAIGAGLLGTAAFTALALLLAGTLRAEGVLALANLVLVLLVVGGGVLVPPDRLPAGLSHVAAWLPSGALGEALRGALLGGGVPGVSILVLAGWTVALSWGAARLFRWQ